MDKQDLMSKLKGAMKRRMDGAEAKEPKMPSDSPQSINEPSKQKSADPVHEHLMAISEDMMSAIHSKDHMALKDLLQEHFDACNHAKSKEDDSY
jgi:hypothetical protein